MERRLKVIESVATMEVLILLVLVVAVVLVPAIQQYRREIQHQRVLMRLDDPRLRRRLPR